MGGGPYSHPTTLSYTVNKIEDIQYMNMSLCFQFHFYQPMYTLIGAGVADAENSERLMTDVLPKYCVLFQSRVEEFDPESSQVQLRTGETVGVFRKHANEINVEFKNCKNFSFFNVMTLYLFIYLFFFFIFFFLLKTNTHKITERSSYTDRDRKKLHQQFNLLFKIVNGKH